jgi:hypothetical protein
VSLSELLGSSGGLDYDYCTHLVMLECTNDAFYAHGEGLYHYTIFIALQQKQMCHI